MIPFPHYITLGISYYLRTTGHYDKSLAVLLTFDCHLRITVLQSLTYKTVLFEQPSSKLIHLIAHWTKRVKSQSIDVRSNWFENYYKDTFLNLKTNKTNTYYLLRKIHGERKSGRSSNTNYQSLRQNFETLRHTASSWRHLSRPFVRQNEFGPIKGHM